MGEILLRAENIDKHFGITHALDNVSFTFEKGEIHALIGENGSGKSTLTSCLTGIYQKDSGKFILEGKEITATNQVEANHQGVAIIVQEIGTLSGLTVAENIFLGRELKKKSGFVDRQSRIENVFGGNEDETAYKTYGRNETRRVP